MTSSPEIVEPESQSMLINCLLDAAGRFPDKSAAIDPFRRLTFAQLTTLAKTLRRLVLKQTNCERVGVMLPGSVGGLGTLLGVLWAGRTIIPLNFLLQARELTAVVRDAGIDLVITTEHFASLAASVPARCVYLEQIGLKRRFFWEKLRHTPEPPAVAADDAAAIVYTSGTTGQPKGVCLTHDNFLSNSRAAIEHFRLGPDHHLLGVLPPFHVFGLTVLSFIPIVLGATVTYVPRFSPQATCEAIRSEPGISLVMAVPSMYAAIARLKNLDAAAMKGIKLAVSGGEPLPHRVYDQIFDRTGIRLMEGYGMTEASPIISCDVPWLHQVGTVGLPLPGVETQLRDENGQVLPDDRMGELYVRGSLVMKGYYNRPAETEAVVDRDGWLRTGDIVQISRDRHITITGRVKDIIIVGGENVYPREVEEVLEQHPGVAESVVIGQQDSMRGEVVVAFVTPTDSAQATETDLRAYCREHLASYKVPRQIIISKDLPRGPSGKILKRELRALRPAEGRGVSEE